MKIVEASENRKLGRYAMAATYRSVPGTCPKSCALLDNGCYAQRGRVRWQQEKAGEDWSREEIDALLRVCARTGRIVRHHVSGDVMGPDGTPDTTYVATLVTLHEVHRVRGYLYTHAWRELDPNWFNPGGYLVANASVDNLDEVYEATELGWQNITVTVPPGTESGIYEGVQITVCPADAGHDITCAQCQLCAKDRVAVIGFVSKNATSHAVVADAWTDDTDKE